MVQLHNAILNDFDKMDELRMQIWIFYCNQVIFSNINEPNPDPVPPPME